MLVIVEDRDIQLFFESLFDFEAARSGDVFQVNTAKTRCHRFDDLNDLLGILCVQADGPSVDSCEFLKQHRLTLHHGHRSFWADVSESKHCGPICYNCHTIPLNGVAISVLGIAMQGHADTCDPRSVSERQIVA